MLRIKNLELGAARYVLSAIILYASAEFFVHTTQYRQQHQQIPTLLTYQQEHRKGLHCATAPSSPPGARAGAVGYAGGT